MDTLLLCWLALDLGFVLGCIWTGEQQYARVQMAVTALRASVERAARVLAAPTN
jgi:hypothetical protein